jgi:phosphoglycerate kinase
MRMGRRKACRSSPSKPESERHFCGKELVFSPRLAIHPPLKSMAKKSIRDIDVTGKRCLVRVDFNVPLDEKDGRMVITDDTRIKETLPTIKYLIEKGAKVILCSHLGRPKGKRSEKESLRPVADHLHTLLNLPVAFSHDVIGEAPKKIIAHMKNGDVALLENVRFEAGEEKNDPVLAKAMAELADIYVNDAFGSAHRAHSSTAGVAAFLPAVSGLLMEKEITYLHDELESPARPFVVILGGAKVNDKIAVINRLLEKADTIIIGGGMAYTFRKLVQGIGIGTSLYKAEWEPIAQAAIDKAKSRGVKLLIPVDALISDAFDFDAKTIGATKVVPPGENIPDGWQGLDIGPESVKLFAAEIAKAKTVIWNGPMGVFEIKATAKGTFDIAEAIAANQGAKTIIGGGDSVKAVKRAGVADKVTFISTGGGASLELLEGKVLPGVAALNDK